MFGNLFEFWQRHNGFVASEGRLCVPSPCWSEMHGNVTENPALCMLCMCNHLQVIAHAPSVLAASPRRYQHALRTV